MSAAALILSTALAAGGAIGSSVKNKQARDRAERYLNSEYYRDPLSTIGNRSLLKSFDERMADETEALNNRAIAGGATMENQLAVRKKHNEVKSNLYSNLLRGEDARRAGIKSQLENVAQGALLQDAQNWQAWGSAASNAALQWGNANLLDNGNTFNADDWAANKEKVFV